MRIVATLGKNHPNLSAQKKFTFCYSLLLIIILIYCRVHIAKEQMCRQHQNGFKWGRNWLPLRHRTFVFSCGSFSYVSWGSLLRRQGHFLSLDAVFFTFLVRQRSGQCAFWRSPQGLPAPERERPKVPLQQKMIQIPWIEQLHRKIRQGTSATKA